MLMFGMWQSKPKTCDNVSVRLPVWNLSNNQANVQILTLLSDTCSTAFRQKTLGVCNMNLKSKKAINQKAITERGKLAKRLLSYK